MTEGLESKDSGAEESSDGETDIVSSRRRLFQMGAIGVVAAAGAAAVDAVAAPAPADAATGSYMVVGESNSPTSGNSTVLTGGGFQVSQTNASLAAISGVNTGGPGITGEASGSYDGISGGSVSGNGVFGGSAAGDGVSGNSATGFGVYGSSGDGVGVYGTLNGSGIGVQGVAPISSTQQSTGVSGTGVIGVQGDSSAAGTSGYAGVHGVGSGAGNPGLLGTNPSGAQLLLQPMSSNTLPGASPGSFAVLENGQLNYCYAPSAWVPLTNGIVSITPTRVVNTSTGLGGITGPLVPGSTVHTTIDLRTGPIPAEATGIIGNFAISGVGGAVLNGYGVATIFPAGVVTPGTANINAGYGCFAISNAVSMGFNDDPLNAYSGRLSIVWGGGGSVPNAHAYLDITGYML